MNYYLSKVVNLGFDEAIARVKAELEKEGFGILTDIDVQATLHKKLNVPFRKYRILGACNPPLAYQALQAERMIGTMLPCNIIVQEGMDGKTEIAAINPATTMQTIGNSRLTDLAEQVQEKLQRILSRL